MPHGWGRDVVVTILTLWCHKNGRNMVQPHYNVMVLHKDLPSVALPGLVHQMYYRDIQLFGTSSYRLHIILCYLLYTYI
jgi:hypothetical protein